MRRCEKNIGYEHLLLFLSREIRRELRSLLEVTIINAQTIAH